MHGHETDDANRLKSKSTISQGAQFDKYLMNSGGSL